jgi:hypothetical protein
MRNDGIRGEMDIAKKIVLHRCIFVVHWLCHHEAAYLVSEFQCIATEPRLTVWSEWMQVRYA